MSRQRQLNGTIPNSSEFDFGNLPDQASPFEQIEAWTQWAGLAGAGTTHGLPSEVQQFVKSWRAPMQDSLDLSARAVARASPEAAAPGLEAPGGRCFLNISAVRPT